jgi:hypothetical protein
MAGTSPAMTMARIIVHELWYNFIIRWNFNQTELVRNNSRVGSKLNEAL